MHVDSLDVRFYLGVTNVQELLAAAFIFTQLQDGGGGGTTTLTTMARLMSLGMTIFHLTIFQ